MNKETEKITENPAAKKKNEEMQKRNAQEEEEKREAFERGELLSIMNTLLKSYVAAKAKRLTNTRYNRGEYKIWATIKARFYSP